MVAQSKNIIDEFLNLLAGYQSDSAFNPWSNNCESVDTEDSFKIRQENLKNVLIACSSAQEVDIWIGRDLGWRGGRRTGVALVDETSLDGYARSIAVKTLAKATVGPSMRERTATEIHLARARIPRKIFFWNVFPFHPHELNKPQSNRMHTTDERKIGLDFLNMVLEILPTQRIITIGNDATNAINNISLKCYPVRHPSYGGQKDFHEQIDAHYNIYRKNLNQRDLFDIHA